MGAKVAVRIQRWRCCSSWTSRLRRSAWHTSDTLQPPPSSVPACVRVASARKFSPVATKTRCLQTQPHEGFQLPGRPRKGVEQSNILCFLVKRTEDSFPPLKPEDLAEVPAGVAVQLHVSELYSSVHLLRIVRCTKHTHGTLPCCPLYYYWTVA
jgi:hypothetical protein